MTYRITGIDPAPFRPLFDLDDQELERLGARRMTVDGPGFPCRVSLTDRAVGETMLLVNHVSHDVANPYRASHAIFVTEGETQPASFADEPAPVFATRTLSLRGFDSRGMMVEAALSLPGDADRDIRALFANPDIATIHAHNATRGCFAARIERV